MEEAEDEFERKYDSIESKLNKCLKRLREHGDDGEWLENNEKPNKKKRTGPTTFKQMSAHNKRMSDIICGVN